MIHNNRILSTYYKLPPVEACPRVTRTENSLRCLSVLSHHSMQVSTMPSRCPQCPQCAQISISTLSPCYTGVHNAIQMSTMCSELYQHSLTILCRCPQCHPDVHNVHNVLRALSTLSHHSMQVSTMPSRCPQCAQCAQSSINTLSPFYACVHCCIHNAIQMSTMCSAACRESLSSRRVYSAGSTSILSSFYAGVHTPIRCPQCTFGSAEYSLSIRCIQSRWGTMCSRVYQHPISILCSRCPSLSLQACYNAALLSVAGLLVHLLALLGLPAPCSSPGCCSPACTAECMAVY
jgi:hypothetical protein